MSQPGKARREKRRRLLASKLVEARLLGVKPALLATYRVATPNSHNIESVQALINRVRT